MKTISFVAIAIGVNAVTAFVPAPTTSQHQSLVQSTTTSRQMGLFDFFNEDARKEREAKREKEIEEQMQMQREIIARRSNPEKFEEYEAKVRVRRALRMSGEDEAADKIEMYSGDDEKIVGLN